MLQYLLTIYKPLVTCTWLPDLTFLILKFELKKMTMTCQPEFLKMTIIVEILFNILYMREL